MSDDSVSFETCCGKYVFYVKASFLRCHPDACEYDAYYLNTKCNISNSLHNPNGPAIIVKDGSSPNQYWLNGRYLSTEDAERMMHDVKMTKQVNDIINE